MKKLFLVALAALMVNVAFAQVKVTGKVTSSSDGQPIPFASIVVKGTMTGVASSDDGSYVLEKVPSDATLVFSSIGFKDQEVAVNGRTQINVILSPDAEALDEVMVVAYGTVKKGSYSGSASVVKSEAIKDAPVVSFEQVLAGKAPGVQVASYSGQPGSEVEINVRGFGSFNAGNQPLYVIDGVAATSGDWSSGNISTSSMNFLNPSDIESITILKDAAAASLYGSRASNGVVLITTKKGKSGKLTTSFKASAGFSYFAYDNYPLCNDEENRYLHTVAWTNYAENNPSAWKSYGTIDKYVAAKVESVYPSKDESMYIYRDWEDVLFRTGINQTYELSVSGGSDKGKVFASAAYTDQQGVVSIAYLKRFTGTINAEGNISKHIKAGASMQYSWQYQTGNQEGQSTKDNPFYMWKVALSENWPYAYKSDGTLYLKAFNSSFSTINPVASYDAQINDATQTRILLKGWAEVAFTDWLKLKSIVSKDWLDEHDKFGWTYGHPNFTAYGQGYLSDRFRKVDRMVSSTTLNFDKTWGDHHVNALVGWEAEKENYLMSRISLVDVSYLGATESVLASTYKDGYTYRRLTTLMSAFASLNYDFGARYYLTGTFRRDGSSRLAPETRWGNFWSVSGSWRFSNEPFLEGAEWLTDGKLRGSYGTSGTLPSDHFGYMSVYDYTVYGDEGASYPSNLANADLSWEKNKNWNVALDMTLFDRVTLSAEYFNKLTTDLLLDAKIPSTTGFSTSLMNVGSMRNQGIELALSVDILKSKDWGLTVGANWSTVKNEVLSLSEEGERQINSTYRRIWTAGYCYSQYYTREYLGVCPENGYMGNSQLVAGNAMYAEGSEYNAGDIADQTVVLKDGTVIEKGQTVPVHTFNHYPSRRQDASSMILEGMTAMPKGYGGFNLDFRWKNLSFSMAWSYKYGHYVWDGATDELEVDGYYDNHRNIARSQLNYWTETNKDTNVPKRIRDNGQGGYYDSSRFLHKGDFLRLKNATISYSLPKSFTQKLHMSNARIYVAGANLLTFSGLTFDPEISSNGYMNYQMPAMRTGTLGLEITF